MTGSINGGCLLVAVHCITEYSQYVVMFKMQSTINKANATQYLFPVDVSYISIEFNICFVLFQ